MILNTDQMKVVESIKKGNNTFITGPGGTGKTVIIKHIATTFKNTLIGITAMTGVAAVLINGATLHSFLGIGLGLGSEDEIVLKVSGSSRLKKKWNSDILVVDEVSMLSSKLFEKLNNVAKRVRNNKKPFGGMQLVFSGDFLQLPCTDKIFCFESETWNECQFSIFNLKKIMRQNNIEFQLCLNRARFGNITKEDLELITKNVYSKTSVEIKPVKIFCKNVDVDKLNISKLEKLPAERIYKFKHKIEIKDKDQDYHMFNDITKFCNAQPTLLLSVGAQVMLLVNLDFDIGLVNGSTGIVVDFIEARVNDKITHTPVVKFRKTTLPINKYDYHITHMNKVVGIVHQIPLKLSYAMTVHKSQGLTLDSALIDLQEVFDYGQAYVAVSRVNDVDNLFIKNASPTSFKANPKAIKFYNDLEDKEDLEESTTSED